MTEAEIGRIAITRALISVHDKTGLAELARNLHMAGVEMVSTGNTAVAIAAAPKAFSTLRSRVSRRARRKTVVMKRARCTGAPKPVSSAYPKVRTMVSSDANQSRNFSLLASQKTRPASRPTCIPETTKRWKEPVRSNPTR